MRFYFKAIDEMTGRGFCVERLNEVLLASKNHSA